VIPSARISVLGGEELASAVVALGFEPCEDGGEIVVIDLRDDAARSRAASLPTALPRVFTIGTDQRELVAALGVDASRVVVGCDAAQLGPAIIAALPTRHRSATRVVLVTSVRGAAGRTLLATNLAVRLALMRHVCLVDATGTGAAAWWLRAEARPWSALEGLAGELSSDQLSVLAEQVAPGLRVVGGPSAAPSEGLLLAAIRAALGLDDIVIVDAPLVVDHLTRQARASADRTIVLAYDDPLSLAGIASLMPSEDLWLIASQARLPRLGQREAFRSLPRDESAVAAALEHRQRIGGQLGRAYDDLAELLLIDAS
jgi:hypothetical protein